MNSYLIYLIKIYKQGIKVILTKKHARESNAKYKKEKRKIIEVKKQVLKYNIYIYIYIYI